MRNASIVVVSAGVSQPSSSRLLADHLARAVSGELLLRGRSAEVRVVEVRDLAHDVVDMTLTGLAAGPLAAAQAALADADAVIAVTPVFAAGPAGIFKSFLDVLDTAALRGTPVLLGATGGTPRHSLVLEHGVRPLFTYLHADTVPTSVFAATGDWADERDGDINPLPNRIQRAAAELAERVAGGPVALGHHEPSAHPRVTPAPPGHPADTRATQPSTSEPAWVSDQNS